MTTAILTRAAASIPARGRSAVRYFPIDGFEIAAFSALDSERDSCERELLAGGVALPLPHRAVWARAQRRAASWFIAARAPGAGYRAALAAEVSPSRALPGHLVVRVERLAGDRSEGALHACVAALAKLARGDSRVLRVSVELCEPDEGARAAIQAVLAASGFGRAPLSRCYHKTLAIDLSPDSEAILAGLSKGTRREIRLISKFGLSLRAITDIRWAPRLDRLLGDVMRRTGGELERLNWPTRLALAASAPESARVVGLFRDGVESDEALVAFACAYHHGSYAHYDAAAALRDPSLKAPLAYALMWDLIGWAKAHGARWFDLGGVTDGSVGSADPLGGISDFKRSFTKNVVTVGEEWSMEPHAVRAWLASILRRGALWLRGPRRR